MPGTDDANFDRASTIAVSALLHDKAPPASTGGSTSAFLVTNRELVAYGHADQRVEIGCVMEETDASVPARRIRSDILCGEDLRAKIAPCPGAVADIVAPSLA